jgi:hypothetical protein
MTQSEAPVRPIAVGTDVMHINGIYTYGGEHEHPGMEGFEFHMRSGERTTVRTSLDRVAPAIVEVKVNPKDPRIKVVKHEKRPGYWAAGPWAASIEDGPVLSWHKTKKSAVEETARRLAIQDWHAEAQS